ncbi:LysM peptidoglycan-binding domain-containing protein [Limosilactobacillus sp.]|uniref:LysM peptidoglycan-binding domain-containing protein n=1 Tax=Limosilactobacillus sp. TaxID=2773925 RepID=UPI003F12BA42
MKFNYKKQLAAAFMTAVLAAPMVATTVATANNASGSPEEQADITNWIANTPQQVSNNMAMQHIDMNNLNGTRYIIQWGDTLSSISAATGISVAKLCYDNNIQNANLIYAGDVLILNRDGDVPAGYDPDVNPYAVAQTKVTINNGPQNVHITVMPKKVVNTYNKYVDNSTNTENNDNSKNVFEAANDAKDASSQDSQSGDNGEATDSSSTSTGTKSKNAATTNHGKKHYRSVSASALVSGLEGASGDSKLSFEEGDGGDDAEEVSVNSAAILKDAKKGDYDAALEEIEDALGDKADKKVTVYIELDGNDLSVYVSTDDDDSSSSEDSNKDDSDSDDNDSSSQDEDSNNDDDSNSQATTNDEDTDSSDDDF